MGQGRQPKNLRYTAFIERAPQPPKPKAADESTEIDESYVVGRLKTYGLGEHEIKILLQRFYDELTFEEIVEESGWTSQGSANYTFQQTLKKLRKMGFRL